MTISNLTMLLHLASDIITGQTIWLLYHAFLSFFETCSVPFDLILLSSTPSQPTWTSLIRLFRLLGGFRQPQGEHDGRMATGIIPKM